MKGDKSVLADLQTALTMELTAVHQYNKKRLTPRGYGFDMALTRHKNGERAG